MFPIQSLLFFIAQKHILEKMTNETYTCIIKHAMNLDVNSPNPESSLLFWVHIVTVLYIMVTNTLLLIALWRITGVFVAVHSLHITLCLVDMTTAMLVALNYVFPSLNAIKALEPATCEIVKKIWITVSRTMIISEPLFFLLIMISRYSVVTSKLGPSNKHFINTKKFVAVLLLGSFALCLVFAFCNIFAIHTPLDTMIITIFYFGFLLATVIGTITLNAKMLLFIKKHETSSAVSTRDQAYRTHHQEAARTLFIIAAVATLCSLPMCVLQFVVIVQVIMGNTNTAHLVAYIRWAIVPFLLNMGLNANIYIHRNRDIRRFFQLRLRLLRSCLRDMHSKNSTLELKERDTLSPSSALGRKSEVGHD